MEMVVDRIFKHLLYLHTNTSLSLRINFNFSLYFNTSKMSIINVKEFSFNSVLALKEVNKKVINITAPVIMVDWLPVTFYLFLARELMKLMNIYAVYMLERQ